MVLYCVFSPGKFPRAVGFKNNLLKKLARLQCFSWHMHVFWPFLHSTTHRHRQAQVPLVQTRAGIKLIYKTFFAYDVTSKTYVLIPRVLAQWLWEDTRYREIASSNPKSRGYWMDVLTTVPGMDNIF